MESYRQFFTRVPWNKSMTIRYLTRKLRVHLPRQRMNYSSQGLSAQTQHPATTVKLDTPEFHALFTLERKYLINIFEKHNHELRIVGGAVRDLLIRKQPLDIDFASVATPEQMKIMFKKENLRILQDAIGESHGTIKVRLNDKENFQITTLRIDEATNGRFAKVEFTKDWCLDARRRDFTVNSLYLGFDGTVYDYLTGIDDLENRKIRFIGDPEMRIREDYLRILRYFRFYGRIAQEPNNHDSETLKVIKKNVKGLNEIHGTTLWKELSRILSGNFQFELMKTMLDVNMAPFIGLSTDVNLREFQKLNLKAADFSLDPMTIIASLIKNKDEMLAFIERIPLRKWERELGFFIVNNREAKLCEDPLEPFKKRMIFAKENQAEQRRRIEQLLSYHGDKKLLLEFQKWKMPTFPVKNEQLLERGVKFGKKFKLIQREMQERWFKSSYTLTDKDLLAKFDEIVREIPEKHMKTKEKMVV